MATHNNDPVAAIALNAKLEGNASFYEKYLPVANLLRSQGITLVALHGKNDHSQGREFSAFYEFGGEGMVKRQSDITVDAARDLTGGIARYTDVAALNARNTRDAVS